MDQSPYPQAGAAAHLAQDFGCPRRDLPHADNKDWLDTVHIDGIPTDDLRRTVPALLATSTNQRTAISSRKPKTAMGVRLRNAKILYMAFPKIAEEGGGR